jgi:hypothetical protein
MNRGVRVPMAGVGIAGVVLIIDAITRDVLVQAGLGVATFVVLWLLTRHASRADRYQVWTCVAVATIVELCGSVFFGVYRYRLGGVPLYVPPGHGLLYLSGLYLSRTRIFAARPQIAARLAVLIAGGWAAAGLTVLHRTDVLGAFFFIYFACFALRSRRPGFFAGIFLLTSGLELAGTALSDWTWATHAPGIGVGVGNPPSVIAGAYCVLDALVILVSRRLIAHRRIGATAPVLEFSSSTEEVAS